MKEATESTSEIIIPIKNTERSLDGILLSNSDFSTKAPIMNGQPTIRPITSTEIKSRKILKSSKLIQLPTNAPTIANAMPTPVVIFGKSSLS